MKRKGLLFVALTVLLCVISLCFVGCNEKLHVHEYKIQNSDTMHWLKCDCGDTKDYNVHSGGTATCISKAKCTTCGVVYGELGDHSYEEWTSNHNSTHSKICIYDNTHVVTEACSGGNAQCGEKAICDHCKISYGQLKDHQTDDSGFCVFCDKAINSTLGIVYKVSDDGTYTEVFGYNGISNKINIASTYNNLPVKNIYDSAFLRENIVKVIIPDSVTNIGRYAFSNCDSLQAIEIPSSVTSIGYRAFEDCDSLQSVTFGVNSKLVSIGDYAFDGCSVFASIEIPSSVTSVGEGAFRYCEKLQSITFSVNSQLNSIGSYAFVMCANLEIIEIPSSVTNIGVFAFNNCRKLQSVIFGKNSKVTSIGVSAFYYCGSLQSVNFGGTMEQWKNAVGNRDIDYSGKVVCIDGTING